MYLPVRQPASIRGGAPSDDRQACRASRGATYPAATSILIIHPKITIILSEYVHPKITKTSSNLMDWLCTHQAIEDRSSRAVARELLFGVNVRPPLRPAVITSNLSMKVCRLMICGRF